MTNQEIGLTNQVIGQTNNQVIGQTVFGGFSLGIGLASVYIVFKKRAKSLNSFCSLTNSADWLTSQVIHCRWV